MDDANLIALESRPRVDGGWVAHNATVVGAVTIGNRANVWYGSVLRGDGDRIDIGPDSNVQDGCVVHADPGLPVEVGRRVSIGHRAVLHGCVIEDDVLIGMGAIVLDGARIGAGSLVAAGAVVLAGTAVPPGSLVAGVPGQVRRATTEAERADIVENARQYVVLSARHAAATKLGVTWVLWRRPPPASWWPPTSSRAP